MIFRTISLKDLSIFALSDKIDEIRPFVIIARERQPWFFVWNMSKPVYEGAQVQIGGHESYISVCRKHWFNPQENIIPLNKA
ncbi:MAG: hypothetical protein ACLUSV_07285 [Streptococcus sp.]